MTSTTTKAEAVHPEAGSTSYLFDDWFDPIEAGLRERVRGFIETMLETELDAVLARPRYGRQCEADDGRAAGVAGHRHGSRTRRLTGTFGMTEIAVPRARLEAGDDKTVEWESKALRAYGRRTGWRWGGCRSPLTASRCAKLVMSKHKLKERASMGEVTIIGVDLAKNVFQLHGAAADGSVIFPF